MYKVLRIINRFNLGGPTYNAGYLTKYMSPEFETLLVGGEKDPTEENSEFIIKNLGIDPLVIPEMKRSLSFVDDYTAYKKIIQHIREFKPDVVHTHASKAGALGRMAASKMGVPVIVHTFHGHVFDGYFGNVKSTVYKNVERWLAKKSSKIIALSQKQKADLVEVYKICEEPKISIVPLGFDLSRFRENMDEKRKQFRENYFLDDSTVAIGIIGRLVPIKNHSFFIKSIKSLKENFDGKFQAFIVGDGEERESIEEMAKHEGLICKGNEKPGEADVVFTSWLKEMDIVLAGLDVVAMTSLNEGTPVSLIEAQASNRPIVTTNVGGVENVVLPGETALLSDVNDIKTFSEQLLKLVSDENLRKAMSEKGWDFVKDKFHYQRLVDDMKNLYLSLLE